MKTTELRQFTISNVKSYDFNNYFQNKISFSLSYLDDESENEIKFCTGFSSCRAYITDSIRTIILNKRCTGDAHTFNLQNNIGIRLSRFLLSVKNKVEKDHLLYCIRIINYYNEISNFPKFKLIGYSKYKDATIFFIKIPMIYKNNPHLFSLFTLLLRVLNNCDPVDLEQIKNIDDLESYLCENKKTINDINSASDTNHIFTNNNYKKFKFIFKDYKKLFASFGKKKLFPSHVGYDFHNTGGIFSLSIGETSNKKLNERSKKFFSKIGEKT